MKRKARKRTNSKVPAKGRLREMADRLWSLAVRDDWNYRCAVCGSGKVEAHHIVPRQHEATRYDLRNGIALCSQHHKFDKDVAPHQNAAGWIEWLMENHRTVALWYAANARPKFDGAKTPAYYIEQIKRLRQYVPDDQFERVVGIRFSAWLEDSE